MPTSPMREKLPHVFTSMALMIMPLAAERFSTAVAVIPVILTLVIPSLHTGAAPSPFSSKQRAGLKAIAKATRRRLISDDVVGQRRRHLLPRYQHVVVDLMADNFQGNNPRSASIEQLGDGRKGIDCNSELPQPKKLVILSNVNCRFSAWAITLALSAQHSLFSADFDWPQWQGANRDGKSLETGFLKTWPAEGLKLIWRAENLGEGYAGVSVVGNRLYTMGGFSDENAIMAIDTKDGRILWSTKFGVAGSVGNVSSGNVFPGPRCTPTLDGDRLYGVDHRGQFICVTANDGKIQWKKHFVDDFGGTVPRWGFSESPLVDGNQVVATPGGPKGALVALNKQTGDVIWQSKEFTDEAHYSSIVAGEIGGIHQYVQLTSENVVGISPKDGSVLWKAARVGKVAVIPTPIVDGNYVYVTAGYAVGCALLKVTVNNGKFTAEQVYENKNMVNHHGGVVKVGDHLYGYSDDKGLVCQNFLRGDIVWRERERVKKGAVSYADGMLYFREERSGDLILIEADPKGYSEKGRFQQPDRAKEMAWPHPVLAAGRLYLRDQNRLLCYDLLGK